MSLRAERSNLIALRTGSAKNLVGLRVNSVWQLKLMVDFVVMMLVATQKKMRIYYITEAAREPNCEK